MTRSKKSKTQSSPSRVASSKSSTPLLYLKEETTKENLSLGDFGEDLWRYLQGEKDKWCGSNISSPLVDIEKQPPRLPHSSSSEYSSEEEIVVTEQKVHKVVQQSSKKKVEGIVTVSKEKGFPSKKKSKKAIRANDLVEGTIIDAVKKVHFNDSTQVNPISRYNNDKEIDLVTNNPKIHNSTKTFRFRIPIPLKISDDPIHVFIDNSNILVGFLAYCKQHTRRSKGLSGQRSKPTLEYDALFTILERGRNIARKVLVASSPLYQSLEKAYQAGYDVSVLKRVKSDPNPTHTDPNDHQLIEMDKEQCVDELLHLKILESLLDYHAPATLVLASGDGKDAEYFEGGFHKCVIKALERGWKVEIISWQRQFSQNFLNKKFTSKWKDLYHVVFLDWFATELGCDMQQMS